MLKSVEVRKFKGIDSVVLELAPLAVLVGSNNSGKSTVLQAVHFAVSLMQSGALLTNRVPARKGFTIAPNQLLYVPHHDPTSVAAGGKLKQDKSEAVVIVLTTVDGTRAEVSVALGKNKNLSVTYDPDCPLNPALESLDRPFSIYVPGLAGLAKTESFVSPGVLRRAVARGDANIVLRNVLLALSKLPPAWEQFLRRLATVFPGAALEAVFDPDSHEYVDVRLGLDGVTDLPFESAGTGMLQVVQLLAYIGLFHPTTALVDEPDSHLHPDNQRRLCRLLRGLAEEGELQVVLATHSRHVLDELREDGKLLWMRRGALQTDNDLMSLLLDLGALDEMEGLAARKLKAVVLTEDAKCKGLRILLSQFLKAEEFEVWSYYGCTNTETAKVLAQHIKATAPKTRVVVHRDSDYLPSEEAERIEKLYLAAGVDAVFFTPGVDIEACFLGVDHLLACNPDHAGIIPGLLARATGECEQDLRQAAKEGRRQVRLKRYRDGESTESEQVIEEWSATLDLGAPRWLNGKKLLKAMRRLFQDETGSNLRELVPSPHLSCPELEAAVLGIESADDPSLTASEEIL